MDRRELVVSSSSQNVNSTIVRISAKGTSGNRFGVELSDGSFFCVRADFLLEKRLNKGLECDALLVGELVQEDALLSCREKGMELLARREHCRKELEIKLRQREFEPGRIEAVLNEFERLGLLDDLRFAQKRAVLRVKRRNLGYTALIADLCSKGVSPAVAKEAVADTVKEADFAAALERAAEKLARKKSMTRDKMIAALQRKGFRWGEIRDTVNLYFEAGF